MKRRAPAIIAAAAVLALVGAAEAQYMFWPYYGKNRIIYEKFAWKTYPTEHFLIYFYVDDPKILKNIVETAESAYRQVSQDLKHDLAEPVPLLYYTTVTDFEQSNVFQVSEGILGVSEPVLFRIGVHGDMALDELQSLITHELAHVFEFDILWGRQGGALTAISQPPLWTFEGLSEYVTREWSLWSTLIVRDAVLNDRIPEFVPSGELLSRYPLPREPAYDFGHAVYEFIVERYGKNAIRDLWLGLKSGGTLLGRRDPFERTFKLKARDFQQEFRKYLRGRVKEFLTRENPEDYSIPLGPEFPMNPYYFAFSHAVSPSGDLVATITFNALDGDIDVVLLSAKDGKVLKNITTGYTTKYEYIKFEIDPSLGRCLAWSPEGDRLAFIGRHGRRHSLFILSPLSGETLREYKLEVDQPAGPCFFPDGKTVMFSAFRKGTRDIFALDLAGGAVANLTNDDLYEKAPAISPDGKSVAYSVRVGSSDKLFLSPLGDFKTKKQLTFGPGQTICPSFSADGRTIYFSGDSREAYNVYSLDLETGEMLRYTDVRTGNFFPAPLPPIRPGERPPVIFSSFNKGAYQLFRSDLPGTAEPSAPFSVLPAGAAVEGYTPVLKFDLVPDKIKPHQGMGKLYVTSRPPADVLLSTDGSFYGGSAIAFSDILGDYTFQIVAYQVRDYQSFEASYLNLRGRLQWMARLFKSAIYYYPLSYYYDPSLWNWATTADAIATREIKGAVLAAFFPFNMYYRAEASLGIFSYAEESQGYDLSSMGQNSYFINGNLCAATFALTGETTLFKLPYGPAAGHTFQISVSPTIPLAKSFLRNTTFQADLRKYFYLGSNFVTAFRWQGYLSVGRDRFLNFIGGNNTVRSANYYGIIGTSSWFLNAEFRFPLVNTIQTLIGNIGPFRGVLFFDMAKNKYGDYPAKFYRYDIDTDDFVELEAIGSYGYGFQMFVFGLPIHLEWVKRLEWKSLAKPFSVKSVSLVSASSGGSVVDFSSSTSKWALKLWIGFDF